ncbi:Uncharacterized protein TCM_009324 [Theobroma cacao]|uniref:Uncharacterized protein n=1 Tax=Theobroma cacao TaxID=3641 RepID=A0A061E4V0_THECC|nr:Uncharacterized protein TCM_009324 [Theobroma cacao]
MGEVKCHSQKSTKSKVVEICPLSILSWDSHHSSMGETKCHSQNLRKFEDFRNYLSYVHDEYEINVVILASKC